MACLEARFSPCLSRRLRNRETPCMMAEVVGNGGMHAEEGCVVNVEVDGVVD